MSANMEEQLTHDRIQAEIAKLMAETARINAEHQNYPVVIEELRARVDKSIAETIRINSENRNNPVVVEELRARVDKTIKETTLYPFIVGASVTLAIVAVVKLFL